MTRHRPVFLALFALGLAGWLRAEEAAPAAQSAAAGSTAPLSDAELASLLALADVPLQTATLRASVGWRDNILLSTFAPISRAFARGEVDAMILRGHGDWQVVGFLTGDVLRFFSPPPETGGEQTWFVHGEGRWQHWPAWRVTLKADAFFQDAVIDLSETESLRTVVPTRAEGGFVTASTELALPGGFTLAPLAQLKRVAYRDFPGDYREAKAGPVLKWQRSETFTLAASWFEHWRRYDDRQEYTAGGRALPNTQLRFRQREGELRATFAWESGGKWETVLTAGRLENRDGASGFFDYDQDRGRAEVTWQRGNWKVIGSGEDRRMVYRIQTVGTGLTPPARVAEADEESLRAEYAWTKDWTLFAEGRHERNRSNETEFSYRANTVLAGVQRAF
ncbi:MAG: hypothetical protein JSR48_10610 [Verrucomicrobia bacterium]|nr:hypothetical protein [Verrucomicrobiota bacterium]